MNSPTIVINAYQRPKSISRLLHSLTLADIPLNTDIIFSLEYEPHPDVLEKVTSFEWAYGQKTIIQQEKKLGLIGHFIFCGGLTRQYGNIIYLEDDLFVGKSFYYYAKEVLQFYKDDNNIAGFSLNTLWFNGYLHTPFTPLDDGGASFFLQVPWYQGQIFTAKRWQHFEEWYRQRDEMSNDLLIHEDFRNYKLSDDWFPLKTQYLIENHKYYCFPRKSHCINFGDAGTHFEKKTNFFQTELAMGHVNYTFKSLDEALAVYDSFYELIPDRLKRMCEELKTYDFELDLNGTKDPKKVRAEYILTSRKTQASKKSYGLEMRPQELNIIYNQSGKMFFLARREDVLNRNNRKKVILDQLNYHHRNKLGKWQKIKSLLLDLIS